MRSGYEPDPTTNPHHPVFTHRGEGGRGPSGPLGPFGAQGDRLYATKAIPNVEVTSILKDFGVTISYSCHVSCGVGLSHLSIVEVGPKRFPKGGGAYTQRKLFRMEFIQEEEIVRILRKYKERA